MLDALGELLKFEYTLYETPDGEYGRMSPDKTWNGVIKELADGVSSIPAWSNFGPKGVIWKSNLDFDHNFLQIQLLKTHLKSHFL